MPFNDEVVVEWISSAMNSHVNNRFNQFLFRYISYYRSKVHYMIHQFYKKQRLIATSKVGRCLVVVMYSVIKYNQRNVGRCEAAAHVRRGEQNS